MLSLTLVTAVVLAQSPVDHKAPMVKSRHHKKATPVGDRLDDLTLDLIGYGEYVVALERRVAELERHRCHCQDHAAKPKPTPTPAPQPVYEWRSVVGYPGLHYYGYESSGVFHVQYQCYDGPAPVRWQGGCAGGACGR